MLHVDLEELTGTEEVLERGRFWAACSRESKEYARLCFLAVEASPESLCFGGGGRAKKRVECKLEEELIARARVARIHLYQEAFSRADILLSHHFFERLSLRLLLATAWQEKVTADSKICFGVAEKL